MLGALWSYEVLGWGGYWAWDPVENASFMPWLLATAFLHSAAVQLRRGVLQSWNFVLVIATFALTILGTFLTRSGVIVSVHSFTQSAIGPALLWFLMIVLVGALGLFAMRAHVISSSPRLHSLFSREGAILLNNLLLALFAFVVIMGTLYPLIVEAISGDTVGVGRPFFDRVAVPLSYLLILAMAVVPFVPYRAARPGVVWGRIRNPLRVGLLAAVVIVLLGRRNGWILLAPSSPASWWPSRSASSGSPPAPLLPRAAATCWSRRGGRCAAIPPTGGDSCRTSGWHCSPWASPCRPTRRYGGRSR